MLYASAVCVGSGGFHAIAASESNLRAGVIEPTGQSLRRFLVLFARLHNVHQFALQLLVVHEFYGERMTQGACKALQVQRLHIHGDFPFGRGFEDQGRLVFFQFHVRAPFRSLCFLNVSRRYLEGGFARPHCFQHPAGQ